MKVNCDNDYIYDIKSLNFEKDKKRFVIKRISNSSLYMRYIIDKDDIEDFYCIDISENDGFIYDLFEELYNSIREYRKFSLTEKIEYNSEYSFRKQFDKTNPTALFQGEKIIYRSDYGNYSVPSKFIMYPIDDGYRLIFERAKNYYDDYPKYHDFNVKIDLINGNYSPLNKNFFAFFDAVYSSFNNKKDEYHQITLDEYISKIKILKKNN